ncbi:YpiB family protein [Vagococcus salmoninarum]|uniref:IDEAL domain-containing protein n=1 Tax=Vagococcus salmoninarum TaxID=2739 RepID=A0A429ZPB3_9ENTE|nr:YpiB family protein [Vagococcus salmoninarum]MBE9388185.1 YpiB family protein [Vagococcus salmoninarum]RST95479.1 hypothetical protein CBF35_07925 [Vagococcus salmoninarum]
MLVNVEKKKAFVEWLNENVTYNRREVYWILNYLMTHPAILNKVVFVEHAPKTPRGLRISQGTNKQEPLELFIEQRRFTDPEQVFHELRMNWKKELYVEIVLGETWDNEFYLAVLEDNPYYSWNEKLDKELIRQLDVALAAEELSYKQTALNQLIDEAIENGDKEQFQQLTNQLNLMTNT